MDVQRSSRRLPPLADDSGGALPKTPSQKSLRGQNLLNSSTSKTFHMPKFAEMKDDDQMPPLPRFLLPSQDEAPVNTKYYFMPSFPTKDDAKKMAMFPRDGGDIKPINGKLPPPRHEVLKEVWTTIEHMRGDFMRSIATQESRLDSIATSMARLSDSLSEQAQVGPLLQKLVHMEGIMEQMPKKDDLDLDELALRLQSRMDLPGVFDLKMSTLMREHSQFDAHLSAMMGELRTHVDESVDTAMTHMSKELRITQDMEVAKFEVLMSELTTILQGMDLEYARLKSEGNRRTSRTGKTEKSGSSSEDRESKSEEHDLIDKFKNLTRVRNVGLQAETLTSDAATLTDASLLKKKEKKVLPAQKELPPKLKGRRLSEEVKEKAKYAAMRPMYNVFDYYYTTGWCQYIARSKWFDNVTMACVCLNAVWIAIEIDLNEAAVLTEADVQFQVLENAFCAYFFLEVLIRFLAFKNKKHAFQDLWFIFDFLIVLNMVVETWIIPFILWALQLKSTSLGLDLAMLRMFRIVKLLRLSRITKLLRAIPELVIVIKAIGFASRSVAVFACLWLIMIYCFAVVMRQISDGTEAGKTWFKSVPDAMNTLLLNGILPDHATIVNDISDPTRGSAFYGLVMTCFIVLASITVMYMLVGVLVEVVSKIANNEKETLTVSYLAAEVRNKLHDIGYSDDDSFTKPQLYTLLTSSDMSRLLKEESIDIDSVVDMLDIIYEDLEKFESDMTFEKVIDLLLNSRGSNNASVKNAQDALRIMKQAIKTSSEDMFARIHDEFKIIHSGLDVIKDEVYAKDDPFAGLYAEED
eukprot:TRINITY_DN17092_c0_g2_i1.p1 TRINITY_DN17092_c0_g2~~TRINITY_DN17092_c0_g2_i1.p1  ORF type:complete len:818 (-),score=141.55 TRINITY_DN17092_c0_g2_i1:228-2648(-)